MMDWQHNLTLLAVACAAVYLARCGWRALRRRGCGTGCGCAAAPRTQVTVIPSDQLALRRRPQK